MFQNVTPVIGDRRIKFILRLACHLSSTRLTNRAPASCLVIVLALIIEQTILQSMILVYIVKDKMYIDIRSVKLVVNRRFRFSICPGSFDDLVCISLFCFVSFCFYAFKQHLVKQRNRETFADDGIREGEGYIFIGV